MQVTLVRNDADATPWGFRLQGGADKNQPITIYRVRTSSVLRAPLFFNCLTSIVMSIQIRVTVKWIKGIIPEFHEETKI